MHVTADMSPAKTGGVRSTTAIVPVVARQLFRSFASATRCDASAQARSRYEPGVTDAGTVSVTDAARRRTRLAADATARAPSRTPSIVYTVLDRRAGAPPRFRTTSVTDSVAPCCETAIPVTTRSGRAGTANALPAHTTTSTAQTESALARVRLLHRPPHEHLHEMAPVLGAPVRVARRIRPLAGDRARDRRRRPTPPPPRRARSGVAPMLTSEIAGSRDAAVRAPRDRGDADRRPVLRPPPELQVAPDVVAA